MTAQLVRGLSLEIKMGPSQLGAQGPPESLLSRLLSSVSHQGVSTCLHPFECWLQEGWTCLPCGVSSQRLKQWLACGGLQSAWAGFVVE